MVVYRWSIRFYAQAICRERAVYCIWVYVRLMCVLLSMVYSRAGVQLQVSPTLLLHPTVVKEPGHKTQAMNGWLSHNAPSRRTRRRQKAVLALSSHPAEKEQNEPHRKQPGPFGNVSEGPRPCLLLSAQVLTDPLQTAGIGAVPPLTEESINISAADNGVDWWLVMRNWLGFDGTTLHIDTQCA